MAVFVCVALVAVTAALGFWKWRKVQRFKVLDNNGKLEITPLKPLKPFPDTDTHVLLRQICNNFLIGTILEFNESLRAQ